MGGNRRPTRSAIVLVGVLAVMWAAVPAFAGITDPAPLRATRAIEQIPSSGGGYLAWAQLFSPWMRVELQRPNGTIVRVNPAGTFGWPGGFDGKRLAYQRASPRDFGNSNIYLVNVKTRRTRGFPASVNSPDWEWGPTISGDLVLFGRNHAGHKSRVMLFDRRTSELQQLAGPTRHTFYYVGQVNGRYAVWTRAGSGGWDVIRYDLRTGSATRIPRPDGVFAQYAPSVTTDGTVYFASGARACGKDVAVDVRPIGGPTTTLFALPPRQDVMRTYVDQTETNTQVVYDPGTCAHAGHRFFRNEDIWGFTDLGDGSGLASGPVAGRSSGSGGAPRSFAVPWAGFVGR